MKPVDEIPVCDAPHFEAHIRPRFTPVIIRGLAEHWPLVEAGKHSSDAVLDMIEHLDTGAAADIMVAPPEVRGRFFYNDDLTGFNFQRQKLSLSNLARHLRKLADQSDPIGIYAGASDISKHLPRLTQDNPLPLVEKMDAVARIWLGNATQVATHFDLSDNIAVVAAGRRRFTLFPPDATRDLYVGPLNMTLAGQPVSMVDPLAPDLELYPDFARAQEVAFVADLAPGDALYIPTLWWHHVAASELVNVLVNYWHNDAQRGGGFLALIHAMLAIREQPEPQREAWRSWFDHFVFDSDADKAADHLPAHGKGVNGPASPQRDEQMRMFILQVLGGR